MNQQAVFNKVARHLLKQGRKSRDGRHCMYRSRNGLKCAVGCLIQKKYYSESIEQKGVASTAVENAVCRSIGIPRLEDDMYNLVAALQAIHDDTPPSAWRRRLKHVAITFGLDFKVTQ